MNCCVGYSGIEAGDLVGAVDAIADGLDGAVGGVPLIEAQEISGAAIGVVEPVTSRRAGRAGPIGAGVGDTREVG